MRGACDETCICVFILATAIEVETDLEGDCEKSDLVALWAHRATRVAHKARRMLGADRRAVLCVTLSIRIIP